ncbi:hypothetical protein L228DRAFT_248144 [Xylona heveae TC161]|uniref:Zn(2)-C6 fungal-type domain-containing protein n=1 Tax=Xylona heveae (strain CBS 132557 / TC161) TaxID=1328760 RepID=A0A165GPX5_XYLHT|nr:hypothetical protein L228DRAFT_248144 [Xylona heveae TC161]KZF22451.1 hypothetical protein L228DRAFT_248144 [Xylona heveae TC161]
MEIDPRLRSSSAGVPPLFGTAPPPSFASNPVRLPPPTSQHPAPSSALPPLSADPSPHQPYYLPADIRSNTEGAAEFTPERTPLDPDGGSPHDPKRSRACEACRGLKVRCEPDPNNPNGSCKRCAKAGRNCVVTVPSRKRQKKTDSRVAELERKIDALTASLHASRSSHPQIETDPYLSESSPAQTGTTHQPAYSPHVHHEEKPSSFSEGPGPSQPGTGASMLQSPAASTSTVAGSKRKFSEDPHLRSANSVFSGTPSSRAIQGATPAESSVKSDDDTRALVYPFLVPKAEPAAVAQDSQRSHSIFEHGDVIDRRLVGVADAEEFFRRYNNIMIPIIPVVVFPPGTTASEIRKSKPILFLAILSVACGCSHPDLQRTLSRELMRIFADRVIYSGEKSLELIQALHVATTWYTPPEHFEELKFYQLVHIAAVMALDIGICKKKEHPSRLGLWREHPWKRSGFPNPESIDARRAWLVCYYLCAAVAMALRRPNLIRWTWYMQECIEVLESSSEAHELDPVLCQLVKSQVIADEIGQQFSMDDPFASVGISDPKIQYALKGFERQLKDWSAQIPSHIRRPSLTLAENVVNLYLHEVAMHVDHNVNDFRPPFAEVELKESTQPMPLTPAHINALTVCLKSCHAILDAFQEYNIEAIRLLPIFFFVRTAYAVVVLIKLYFGVTAPNSEFAKAISKDDLKVEHYLDGLVGFFQSASEDGKSKPASKFLMILIMLKTWFQRQKSGKGPLPFPNGPGVCPLKDMEELRQGESTNGRPPRDHLQKSNRDTTGYPPGSGFSDGTTSPNGSQLKSTSSAEVAQPGFSSANTPLHLLSEVAMGNSSGADPGAPMANAPRQPGPWYGATLPERAIYAMGSAAAPPPGQKPADWAQYPGESGLEYSMGDGMEQAMGMALGDGDLSDILGQDGFLNWNWNWTDLFSNPNPNPQ